MNSGLIALIFPLLLNPNISDNQILTSHKTSNYSLENENSTISRWNPPETSQEMLMNITYQRYLNTPINILHFSYDTDRDRIEDTRMIYLFKPEEPENPLFLFGYFVDENRDFKYTREEITIRRPQD
jgi:hypothetical protein